MTRRLHRSGIALLLAVGCSSPESAPPTPAPVVEPPPPSPPPAPAATGTIGLGSLAPAPAPAGTIGLGSFGPIPHAGVVRSAVPTLEGDGLSVEVVRRVVRRRIGAIRDCYEAQLAPAPDLAGRLTVRWRIQEGGTVADAAVASSTLTTTTDDGGAAALAVGTCVVEAIGRSVYPAPDHGTVVVEYPFVLSLRSALAEGETDEPADEEAEPTTTDFGGLGLTGTGRGGS